MNKGYNVYAIVSGRRIWLWWHETKKSAVIHRERVAREFAERPNQREIIKVIMTRVGR